MHADSKKIARQLAIAKGQIDGIQKMVDNDAYCIDISNQLLSTITLLKNVNQEVIKGHLEHCVMDAKTDEEKKQKIEEIEVILKRMNG